MDFHPGYLLLVTHSVSGVQLTTELSTYCYYEKTEDNDKDLNTYYDYEKVYTLYIKQVSLNSHQQIQYTQCLPQCRWAGLSQVWSSCTFFNDVVCYLYFLLRTECCADDDAVTVFVSCLYYGECTYSFFIRALKFKEEFL